MKPSDKNETAEALAEKLGAFLFIVGGDEMVRQGFVEFSAHRPWLTQKGCALLHAVLDNLPKATL